MPLTLRRGKVTALVERSEGLVRLEVDGRPCLAYPRLTGPVALGDDVVVNTQAVDLGLGSGGYDILVADLTRGLGLAPEPGAHVMKLPYTPLQLATVHAEEGSSAGTELDGLPVVCCTLHSQLAPVCAGLAPGLRVAYVQVAGGALPVSLSDALRALKARGLVETAVAVGPCLDGDVACVSIGSALAWARERELDVVVCGVGPGIVGTSTPLGHGATALAEAAFVAAALGGRAILAARISTADSRERHAPLSHHTRAVLRLAPAGTTIAWPSAWPGEPPAGASVVRVDAGGWREACSGLPLETMGRGADDDPWFFAAAFAAGRLAREWTR